MNKYKGFVYKNNGGIRKGVQYLICSTKYCKGSAKRVLANNTTVELVKHTHDPDEPEHDNELLKKRFMQILKDRSVNETTRLRNIYDEEMISYLKTYIHRMSTEESQQFCLRWHNYQSSLMSTLPQLLNHDDLTDVTLCAGLRTLKAHRVVLSACSDYFKQLFKALTKELGASHHPVIVLPGVEFTDLCALVTFMYSGEVNVYEHQLASMLSMADTLHIKGLAEFSNVPGYTSGTFEKSSKWKRPRVEESEPFNRVMSRPTMSETEVFADLDVAQDLSKRVPENDNQDDTVNLATTVDHKPSTSEINVSYGEEAPTPTDLVQGPVVQGSQSDNNKSRTPVSKLYTMCFICGKQLSNHYNLRVHMETHQNAQYACSVCSHVSRSRDALRKHVSYRHPRPNNNNTTTDNSSTVDSSHNVNKLPST